MYVLLFVLATRNGKPYFITGLNYWACADLAADASAGGNLTRLETELKQMHDMGVNNIRIMAS